MTFTDFSTHLTRQIRAEGARSFAVVVGLHLAAIGWKAARPSDHDTEIPWALAAITTLSVLDHINPQPRTGITANNDAAADVRRSASKVAELLTAIADVFAEAANLHSRDTWYDQAERELRSAVATLA